MVRIATWNLENLFRPGGEFGPRTEAAYQAKLTSLAREITGMALDVLAVQEVGDPNALADLADRVGGQWHRATADPDSRGIRVGFLSRLTLTDVTQVKDFPAGIRPIQVDDTATSISVLGRAALQVRVEVEGHAVDLVTCHLKSKLLSFGDGQFSTSDESKRARFGAYALYRRAAEAATVRAAATGLLTVDGDAEARVIVLGDLNDVPEAATTQILSGPPGSEIGTAGYDQPDQGDRQRLWNLAARIPEPQRFTRIFRGRPELIDHILVHALVDRVADGAVTTTGMELPSITEDPGTRRDAPGSDHRPVLAAIDL